MYEFTQWLSGKKFACSSRDAGDANLIPGSERSSGVGHDNPLQYFCLKSLMDR